MLQKPKPGLLTQHGKKTPGPASFTPPTGQKRLDKRPPAQWGWRPEGIILGREEVLFTVYPERFINDPRFAGRSPLFRGPDRASTNTGTPSGERSTTTEFPSVERVFSPESW